MKPKVETTEESGNFSRRDRLLEIQAKAQALWGEKKLYESEVDASKPKLLLTFPYPYMNALLHLGHAFSCSKVEFYARYKRLKGFNVLFPFGFHCTGMPICAAAKKLEAELANDGLDKLVELASSRKEKDPEYKLRKMTQFEILLSCYIEPEEIKKFVDPLHWVHYFPELALKDLTDFGFSIDPRRSFITTDVNPYYDSFIRWQFIRLKEKGFLKFGKRPSIFSEKDNQICADHDRSVGEGVLPQEYTLIKLELLESKNAEVQALREQIKGAKIILPAATLRPETMYGQTNCFILPTGQYGVYRMKDGEIWIMSTRSARNASFQDLTPEFAKLDQICTIKGECLIGASVKAPLASFKEVFVWPMLSISMEKGTGVVTSVPSDAPDDYAVMAELKKKKPFREKFGLTDEQVLPFEPVPIIEVPEYSNLSAVKAYTDTKISSMNDAEGLAKIKAEVYTKGFYKGRMLVGSQAGSLVQDAKPLIKAELVAAGLAATYYEPDGACFSRSGDECVVTFCDQWYINYGEKHVMEKLLEYVKSPEFSCFNEQVKSKMIEGVEWLKEWGCSRSFGLGTRMPWDENYLIESLSDSTIYMAYYAVAHMLQGDLEGTKPGELGIKPEDLTPGDWDSIFLGKPRPEDSKISPEATKKLRESFEYWYPIDLRCSGKDLAKNHLTMSLYNHEFIWGDQPKSYLPRGYFMNGWILVDGEKMSKMKGNFILMKDMIKKYGSDASRVLMAYSGDSISDANAEMEQASNAILKITTLESWLKETRKALETFRTDSPEEVLFADQLFENRTKSIVQSAEKHYEGIVFREAVVELFFNLVSIKDSYKINCGTLGPHRKLIIDYIHYLLVSLYPIIPHFCEVMWVEEFIPMLNEEEAKGFPKHCFEASYPSFPPGSIDFSVLKKQHLIKKVSSDIGSDFEKHNSKKGAKTLKEILVIVATGYKDWQVKALEAIQNATEENFKEEVKKAFAADKKLMGSAMQFADFRFKEYLASNNKDELSDKLAFSELELLTKNIRMITRELKGTPVRIISTEEALKHPLKNVQQAGETASPGQPKIVLDLE